MEILEFNASYTKDVTELILNIQRNEFGISITEEQQPDLKDISSFYQHGNGNFWISTESSNVTGTISLLDIGGDAVALRKMFVREEYRGKEYGVAASLLKHALSWAEAASIKFVYLGTTAQFLAAHRFYEKNGFVEISKDKLPGTFPVMKVDSKFYQYVF